MKKLSIKIWAIALGLGISLFSCKKGDQGPTGNANVIQMNFGSTTFENTVLLSLHSFVLKGITKEITEKSMILSYGRSSLTKSWHHFPGTGSPLCGDMEYRTAIHANDPSSILDIQLLQGIINVKETFDQIRVVIIPANTLITGRGIAPYDIRDYESVRVYFNLPQ